MEGTHSRRAAVAVALLAAGAAWAALAANPRTKREEEAPQKPLSPLEYSRPGGDYEDWSRTSSYGPDEVHVGDCECGTRVMADERRSMVEVVAIDTPEQLAYAEREWGLDGLAPFLGMVEGNPIEDNFYILALEERPLGGPPYPERSVGSVMFREGRLGVDILLVSEEGNTAWGEVVAWGEARSARLHMAAVPRSLHAGSGLAGVAPQLYEGPGLGGVVYPGEERDGAGYWWRPCRVGSDDAHIESWPCLPSDGVSVPPGHPVVVDTAGQLALAAWEWGLAGFAPLREMVGGHPLEDHFYLMSYEELAQRGPGPLSRAVGVSWDSTEIRLTYDRESPLFGDGHAPEGATGVLTVAAVPRRYADGVGFYDVVYPGVGLVPTPRHPV